MAQWDKAQAQAATRKAEEELNAMLSNLTEQERVGFDKVKSWLAKWYNGASGYHATGYKALGRILVNGRH